MLTFEKVREVKQLIDDGGLSRRAIAAATGVSRGSVNAIANGERGLHGIDSEDLVDGEPPRSTIAARCPDCGGMVFRPCVLCDARRYSRAA